MEKTNVYDRARGVVRELVPLLHTIREHDKSLADQLKRAAQSVVLNIAEGRGNDAGNARARFSTACGSAKEVRAALNVASDWGYIEGWYNPHRLHSSLGYLSPNHFEQRHFLNQAQAA